MNNDYRPNDDYHNINNNDFDNEYQRRTPPPPSQIDDEIKTDRDEHQMFPSFDQQQMDSSRTQV